MNVQARRPTLSRRDAVASLAALVATADVCSIARAASPLRGGYVPSTLFAPLFVASDRGYLSARGVAADLTPIVAGQDALALVATGQLDFIAAGLSAAFFNAVSRGLDVRIVASAGYQPHRGHPSALMVREDLYRDGLRDVRGLKGKRIAFNGGAGAASAYYVTRILRRAHLTLADVETVNLDVPDQGVALERRAVDAVFASAPSTQAFVDRRVARVLASPPAGISATGIFFGRALLGDRRRATALLDACRRGARELSGDGYLASRTLTTLGTYTLQTPAVLRKSDRYDFMPDLRIDRATLLDMQREFLHAKLLAYAEPLPEAKLVARL